MDMLIVVKIVELCLIHSPTIAAKMITGLNTDHITIDQIDRLIVKSPKSYFKEADNG